jgi:hypothetical protein
MCNYQSYPSIKFQSVVLGDCSSIEETSEQGSCISCESKPGVGSLPIDPILTCCSERRVNKGIQMASTETVTAYAILAQD